MAVKACQEYLLGEVVRRPYTACVLNERILVGIERDGVSVPVTKVRFGGGTLHERGVELGGESSAWPRGVAMNLRPDDAATKAAVERVQRRLDWFSPRRFQFAFAREEERLSLSGVDPEALPAGRYRFQLRLGGMRMSPSTSRIRIPRDGAAHVTMSEKRAGQWLRLNRPPAEFDEESLRILKNRRSRLDGRPALEWLTEGRHRDRRKACLLNLLAKLAALPAPGRAFQRGVESVFFAEADRIYIRVKPELLNQVRRSPLFARDAVVSATHEKLFSRIPGGEDGYSLQSYREGARPSMQMTFAVPRDGTGSHYADVDVDLGSPNWDLVSFAIHLGELVNPARTNHFKLRSAIQRQTGGDFTYYDLPRRSSRPRVSAAFA